MDSPTEDWQSKSLIETNLYMLDNQVSCDITLVVGEDQTRLPVHKFMLISRSCVFYAMFCGNLAENGQEVIIPDIEAKVMKKFLRYLYSEEVHPTPDNVMALMYTAKKYAVVSLVEKCCSYLQMEIKYDNVCTILEQAHLFDEKDLRDQCYETIFSNSKEVFCDDSNDFQNLCFDCFKKLLESDRLEMKEELIFSTCLQWAEEHCRRRGLEINHENQREVLGEILFLIRFSNMTPEFFTEFVSAGEILTAEEKVDIYQQFNRSPRGDYKPEDSEMFRFPTKRRISTVINRVNRFLEVVGGTFDFWVNDNLTDAISFSASRDVNLIGLSVFSPFKNGMVRGRVQLYDRSNRCLERKHNLELMHTKDQQTVEVKFRKSVKIIQGEWYTITQQLIGAKSFLGRKGQKQVLGKGVMFTFRKSPMDRNDTDVESGQIPALLYN